MGLKDQLPSVDITFERGLSLGGGKLPPGFLAAASNVVYEDHALRSRNGQRYVGIAAPLVYGCTVDVAHVQHFAAGFSLAGATVADTWYVMGQFIENSVTVPIEVDEGIWRCPMFLMQAGTANPTAGVTAQAAYWNGNAWVDIDHAEYDATSRALRPCTTHMGADDVLLVLGVNRLHPHGDDTFFPLWASGSPWHARRGFWIRFTVTAGTVGAGAVVGTPRGYLPVRPQAMTVFQDTGGTRRLQVYGGTPVPRSTNDSVANGTHNDRFIEFFTDLYEYAPALQVIPGNPMVPTYPGNGLTVTMVRDGAGSFMPSTGWQVRNRTTDGNAGTAAASRVLCAPESLSLVAETGRVLLTTPAGLHAFSVDLGNEEQFSNSSWRLLRRYVHERFPRGQNSDPAAYAPSVYPQMHHIGRPAVIANFDGQQFAAYSDGFLRWAAFNLNEGCWNDSAFHVLADEDSRGIVAARALGGTLVCYSRNSIWLVRPTDSFVPGIASSVLAFTGQKAHGGIGAVGVNAVASTPTGHVFAAPGGVYRFALDGPPARLSDPIQRLFDTGLSRAGAYLTAAAYYARRQQVWFSYVTAGAGMHDTVLVLDLATNAWWKHDDIEACLFTYDEEEGVLYSCDSWGRVWEQDYGSADGMGAEWGIPWSLETGPVHEGFVSAVYRVLNLAGEQFPGTRFELALRCRGVEQVQQQSTFDVADTTLYSKALQTKTWTGAAATGATYANVEPGGRRKIGVGLAYDDHEVNVIMRSLADVAPGQRLVLTDMQLQASPRGDRMDR